MKTIKYIVCLVFVGLAHAKVVVLNYPASGCITCHKIGVVKMNSNLYVIGSFYSNGVVWRPLLIAVDSSLNVLWYRYFLPNGPYYRPSSVGIDEMVQIDANRIAVSGGYPGGLSSPGCPDGDNNADDCAFIGVFNVSTQSWEWVRFFYVWQTYHLTALGIDYDGANIVTFVQTDGDQGAGGLEGAIVLKVNANNANVVWSRKIELPGYHLAPMDIINDAGNTAVIFRSNYKFNAGEPDWSWRTIIVKLDGSGNTLWVRGYWFGGYESPYSIIRAIDGNYIVVGHRCPISDFQDCSSLDETDDILVFKVNASNGNLIWVRTFSSNQFGWISEDRAYNASLDIDGNILIVGFVRNSSTSSYPVILKVDNNGNLLWSRYWFGAPSGQSSNEAKAVVPINLGSFIFVSYIGSGVNASGGLAIVKDNINLQPSDQCTQPITFTSGTPASSTANPPVSNANWGGSIWNDSKIGATPSITISNSCYTTPISSNEIQGCDFRIIGGKSKLEIIVNNPKDVVVFESSGRMVFQDKIYNRKVYYLKPGIYFIKLDKKKMKIIIN
jgi:hypothetical protein